ncbi:MAG TPA: M3 family peptidase, partial [Planctomycetaceae bacterium]|nr:M3 family peptidase [Planctomycetaceae bacterium]
MVEAPLESAQSENPLLIGAGLPRSDRIEPEHVVPAVRKMLRDAEQRLAQIEQTAEPSWERTVAPLQEVGRAFERTWQPVQHLFGVKNSAALREAYETVLPEVVRFGLRVRQSRPIYEALRKMRDGEVWDELVPTRRRIVERRLLAAELSGVGLDGPERKRFNAIQQELSQLSTTFANQVLDATKAFELVLTERSDVEGLPESLRRLAADSYN